MNRPLVDAGTCELLLLSWDGKDASLLPGRDSIYGLLLLSRLSLLVSLILLSERVGGFFT